MKKLRNKDFERLKKERELQRGVELTKYLEELEEYMIHGSITDMLLDIMNLKTFLGLTPTPDMEEVKDKYSELTKEYLEIQLKNKQRKELIKSLNINDFEKKIYERMSIEQLRKTVRTKTGEFLEKLYNL